MLSFLNAFMNFNWPIIGHSSITNFLQGSITNSRLAHAYLFHGPDHVGKTTVAENFVTSILCFEDNNHKKSFPCGTCSHCQQIKKSIHPDVAWYERNQGKKEITVEQIRGVIEKLTTTSFLGSYKIGIIKNADQMSLAAANSLLKTLEEPSQKTILVLTAEKLSNIPSTIISRCLMIEFRPVSENDIYKYLTDQLQTDTELAINISKVSLGRPGTAINLATNKKQWQEYQEYSHNLINLIGAPIKTKFDLAQELTSDKIASDQVRNSLVNIFKIWQTILRDLTLLKLKKSDKLINNWLRNELFNISQTVNLSNLLLGLHKLESADQQINRNVNIRLLLENFFLYL